MLLTNIQLKKRLTLDEVVAGGAFLPSAPRVLPQLYRLLRGGEPTLQEVSGLLRLDPGLTARVLNLGNHYSARRGEPCFALEDAINAVGFDTIYAMVSQVADEQVFERPLELYGLDADEYWRASVACALAAEMLAEATGEDAGVAYMTGLLHGAGMFAIDQAVRADEPWLTFASRGFPREFADAERALLGFTQADVAAGLLRRWNLPAIMVEPVRWQLTPLASPGYARMACVLHAAKWMRAAVCADEDGAMPPLPAAEVLKPLRLSPEMLAGAVVDLRVKLGFTRNLLEISAA